MLVACKLRFDTRTDLYICKIVSLHGSDTSPVVEFHLPNPTETSQKIFYTFARLDIP
jgi:hypothetical protein